MQHSGHLRDDAPTTFLERINLIDDRTLIALTWRLVIATAVVFWLLVGVAAGLVS